jgi:uncharacterized membrane protein
MDEALVSSGRLYAAVALALVGAGLMVFGIARVRSAIRVRRRSWPGWALTYLYVFRAIVVGACLIGVALGLLTHLPWLLAASACIGLGELIESTYYIVVIERGGLATRQGRYAGAELGDT